MVLMKRRRVVLSAAAAAGLGLMPGRGRGQQPLTPGVDAPRPSTPSRAFHLPRPIQGMTVSCPTYGAVWGSARMAEALGQLRALGVEWVSIHPYARIGRDGRVGFSDALKTEYLFRCVRLCKEAGMKLFYKPHLAYWGSFAWRGAITFASDEAWERFFESYRAFIVDHARFAAHHQLPLFCLGVELDQTVQHPGWQRIIAAVRAELTGPITYAANWDAVGQVPFWSALDVIGVQGYFPVGRALGSTTPSHDELQTGWASVCSKLSLLSLRQQKHILFTELGYPRAVHAANTPWKPGNDRDERVVAHRLKLMDVALDVLARQSWYAGAFWWKWIPGPTSDHGDFSMKAPEARAVLKRRWAGG